MSEEPKPVSLLSLLRQALWLKKAADVKWGTSKHHGSKHYPTISERKAKHKAERLNRQN